MKKNTLIGAKPIATALLLCFNGILVTSGAVAQEVEGGDIPQEDESLEAVLDTVVVRATKKSGGENVQDTEIAMAVFGARQLEALQVRDVSGLSFKMPNVALDEVGTVKGVANFSIRGLGVNSSIPSIDPAVGVFVDGVYLGVNAGVVFDTFDLASIETLRGPQGVLFGRNVTGGAVLINTSDPTDTPMAKGKITVESGLRGTGINKYAQGVVSGPIISDVLFGKLGIYHNDDEGWFNNSASDTDFGESQTTVVRTALRFEPSSNFTFVAKYEHGNAKSDGAAAQSHENGAGVPGQIVNFDRNSFDFAIDEPGFSDAEWNQFSAKADLDVAFGQGTITNIFGYRDFTQFGRSDIDSSPAFLFHGNVNARQEQYSNELRFNGRFLEDRLDVTTGVYYFEQLLKYGEQRDLLGGALTQDGGGVQDHQTFGLYFQGEYELSDKWSLNAGIRYSDESKDVEIASLIANVNSPCSVVPNDPRSSTQCNFDFLDDFNTSNWSPKIGLSYEAAEDLRFYGHWTRSFRAGGFNFRNTAVDTVNFGPGPFEDERIDAYEIGFKSEPFGTIRLNGAIFLNELRDLQREINLADPSVGIVQLVRNTADAEIMGLELDAMIPLTRNFILTGSIGLLDGEYQAVTFDLNGDGIINNSDLDLDIPRLAPLSANIGMIYEIESSSIGDVTLNANYAYRDQAAYTDNNFGILNQQNRFDASVTIDVLNTGALVTLYGKNLGNDVLHGNDTALPSFLGPVALGGTFAPLNRGRQVGLELAFEF